MPRIEDLGAIPRKIKPILFIVELFEDNLKNQKVSDFLRKIIDRIYYVSAKSADYELCLGLLPYGTMCNPNPLFLCDCEEIEWDLLYGEEQITLSTIFERISNDLSKKELLCSPIGYYLPTVYLVNECGLGVNDEASFNALIKNRWFSFGKRWVIHSSDIADGKLTNSFAGYSEHITTLSFDQDIDSFIGNLLYSTEFMGWIGPGVMYRGMSITSSLMETPLTQEELSSVLNPADTQLQVLPIKSQQTHDENLNVAQEDGADNPKEETITEGCDGATSTTAEDTT